MIKGGSVKLFALLLNNSAPFLYLLPVLFYFFIRNTLNDSIRVKRFDFLHYLPFLIHFIGIVPYTFFTDLDYKVDIAQKLMCNLEAYLHYDFKLFYPHVINLVARPLQFGLYFIFTLFLFWKFIPKYKTSKEEQKKQFEVVFYLLGILFITFIIIGLNQIFFIIEFLNTSDYPKTLLHIQKNLEVIGFLYLVIPVSVLLNPKFAYGMPQSKYIEENNRILKNEEMQQFPARQKYPGTNKSEDKEAFVELSNKIIHYIQQEKPFLNPEFSVLDVCVNLKIPQHQVQYCFNVILNKKFADFKNECRVNYAIELIQTGSTGKISIEGIGKLSGFASPSNFYSAFKKITGFTPNQWMENQRNSMITSEVTVENK